MKKYMFTSESVTEGHPDKVCDLISDKILDACLEQDKNSRVAAETFAAKDTITVAGEITTTANINVEKIVRDTLKEIGYDKLSYGVKGSDLNKTKSRYSNGSRCRRSRRPRNNVWIC